VASPHFYYPCEVWDGDAHRAKPPHPNVPWVPYSPRRYGSGPPGTTPRAGVRAVPGPSFGSQTTRCSPTASTRSSRPRATARPGPRGRVSLPGRGGVVGVREGGGLRSHTATDIPPARAEKVRQNWAPTSVPDDFFIF